MGCQKSIASAIVSKGADYVLALKDNQKTLCRDVTLAFVEEEATAARLGRGLVPTVVAEHHVTVNGGHGRLERRVASVISDRTLLTYLDAQHHWPHLAAVGRVTSTRTLSDGTTTVAHRHYLLSQALTAEQLNAVVRTHWEIENKLHYVMDVTFLEDQNHTVRSAENLSRMRQMALNLLRLAPTERKTSLRRRRKQANWAPGYLRTVLAGTGSDRGL
jgi:predicted transposase YbfD/YdcC